MCFECKNKTSDNAHISHLASVDSSWISMKGDFEYNLKGLCFGSSECKIWVLLRELGLGVKF